MKVYFTCLAMGLSALLLLSSFIDPKNPPKTVYQEMELKGEVKSVKVMGDGKLLDYLEFNKDHKLLFREKGGYKSRFTYDDKGLLLKLESQIAPNMETYPISQLYAYDASGKMVYIKDNNLWSPYTDSLKYDLGGKLVKEIYISNGKLNKTLLYTYDKTDNLIQVKTCYEKDTSTFRFYYDERNNRIAREEIGKSGQAKNRYTYAYDAKNNLLEEKIHELDIRYVHSYNSKNQLIQTIKYGSDNAYRYTEKLSYDAQGNCTSVITQNADGTIDKRTISYAYDNHQNWIKRSGSTEELLYGHVNTERIISYY